MKDKVIEAAGKTWQFLGQNGQTEINSLSKRLKEKNDVVLQSLGWLAREDKIRYDIKQNKTFVSLIEDELRVFNTVVQNAEKIVEAKKVSKKRKPGRSAKAV
ncbi:MAG: winged helix-turn-helix domain-containing protein [Candidatus Omnitrophica bacterium]|nr:winged helix-turn-helix domain-containing protein [Candidatus Omnitrophota bacterium]MCB9747306.1 winged helix-turn-helix domain-containing protein [Candidatus Omnitrophota bacterium]